MIDPDVLIAEFGDAAAKAAIEGWPCQLRPETQPAPHQKPVLPPGEGAVYVFAISAAHGRSAPCGPGTVLKVGRVGPNTKRRFRRSHYNPAARTISTLAQSLLAYPILWPWLGIQDLDAEVVEDWMLTKPRSHPFLHARRPRARLCRLGGLRSCPSRQRLRGCLDQKRGSRTAAEYSNAIGRERPRQAPAGSDLPQRPPTTSSPGVRIEGVRGS